MLSRHRKTREWQRELKLEAESMKRQGWEQIKLNFPKKLKGATPASVHPSRNKPLNLSHKVTGATLGTLSKIWPSVKWVSTLG